MKSLVIMTASPGNLRFAWEHYIYLNNLREKGLSGNAEILVFIPTEQIDKGPHPMWRQLETDFPETKFFYYNDNKNVKRLIEVFGYIPLLRPYCLSLHFRAYPELREKAIFYTDSDILLTEDFDFSPFLNDDVCYLSNANSYTNASYFLSKYDMETDESSPIFGEPKWMLPGRYETFKRRDILMEVGNISGITREKIEEHNDISGAAQYLLKNIDYIFWNNVFDASIELYSHLFSINKDYMRGSTLLEKQNNGWQAWCSDIWAVQFSLYKRNYIIQTPSYFDFTWATDDIGKLKEARIYHNAGITSDGKLKRKVDKIDVECKAFYKGDPKYTTISPFDDKEQANIDAILNDPITATFAIHWYVEQIKKVKTLYNL